MNSRKSVPSRCESCGGQIEQLNSNTYKCMHCDTMYYVSTSTVHKVGISIPIINLLIKMASVIVALIVVCLIVYHIYTSFLVRDASRFSVAFRDFLLEVYDKPVVDIHDEDLVQIKYLCIERQKKAYHFTYSFEDYYDYAPDDFENHTKTVVIKEGIEDFSPSNIQYLTGLTRLELYVDSWHNFVLPQQNQVRSIICQAKVSRYGNSTFFENINPDTLEEVALYSEENLDEDRYILEDIKTVQSLTLERLVYDDPHMFKDFTKLKELYLLYPVMDSDNIYELIEAILQCPELKRFVIEGKAAWYLSDDEWDSLQNTYGEKIELERK